MASSCSGESLPSGSGDRIPLSLTPRGAGLSPGAVSQAVAQRHMALVLLWASLLSPPGQLPWGLSSRDSRS